MNRNPNAKGRTSAAALLSAGVLLAGAPAAQAQAAAKTAAPAPKAPADRSAGQAHIKFAASFQKWHGTLCVAGMLNQQPVFKTAQGEFFQVEPATGDLKFHSAESLGYIKVQDGRSPAASSRSSSFMKWDGIKGESKVSVVGVDAQGRVLQENSRGERFHLDRNGDMVFVK